MTDNLGGIQRNHTFSPASQPNTPLARKPVEREEPSQQDLFANADINPDTMEKIPDWAQKYFSAGNKVDVLADSSVTPKDKSDDIFAQIEKMVKGAESSIQIEMYNLDKKSMVDLLCKEATNGIKIQVVTHPADKGSLPSKQAAIDKMKEAGIEVLEYPVKVAGVDDKYGNLMHVKLLVVDGKQAIIGGMNWGEHSPANHDFDVRVEGPAVDRMKSVLREDWQKSGGNAADLPPYSKTPPHPEGDALVNVITSGPDPNQQTVGKTVIRAIDNAKHSVHAEMFTLTDKYVVQSLINAKKRGVDVKVIVNPLKIKDFAVNEKAVAQLKEAGVPVKWYVCDPKKQEKLHAKIGIIDDDQSIVASANWTYAGFKTNREAGVEILSKQVNSDLQTIFEKDWETRTSDEPIYLEKPDHNAGG